MFNLMNIFKKTENKINGEWRHITAHDLYNSVDVDDLYQLSVWYEIYDNDGKNPVVYNVTEILKVHRMNAFIPCVNNRLGHEIYLETVNGNFQFLVFVPSSVLAKYE